MHSDWSIGMHLNPWRKFLLKDQLYCTIRVLIRGSFFIDRHLALIFYYFFLYTVFVCKFRPKESQSDVVGDLRRIISLVVGPYFDMPPLLLPGLEPATPGTPTVLTRVRCLSLKPDMDREVRSHPDSRISAKVQS
jgi:hypothetical protein